MGGLDAADHSPRSRADWHGRGYIRGIEAPRLIRLVQTSAGTAAL